ncbi:MAG TPA: NUDIX hydrolase, partial [Alcanivorax sp.]|nr:NUDIX hydrolase [Alcanivorax sp.]
MNSFQAHIIVATVVEHEGRLLFVRETQNGEAVINQPAGHAEFGEDLMQAAYRETLEETAWRVDITGLLGWYIFQPYKGAGVYYRTCFIAEPRGHDPHQKLDTGILEALWLTPEELAQRRAAWTAP